MGRSRSGAWAVGAAVVVVGGGGGVAAAVVRRNKVENRFMCAAMGRGRRSEAGWRRGGGDKQWRFKRLRYKRATGFGFGWDVRDNFGLNEHTFWKIRAFFKGLCLAMRHISDMPRFKTGMARFRTGMARFKTGMARFKTGIAGFKTDMARIVHSDRRRGADTHVGKSASTIGLNCFGMRCKRSDFENGAE